MPSSEETYVPERTNVQDSSSNQEASTLSSPLADSRNNGNDTIRAQENSKQSDPSIRNVLASCPLELSNSSTAATNAGSGRSGERSSCGTANGNSDSGNTGADGNRDGSASGTRNSDRNGRGRSESGTDSASGGRGGTSSGRNGDSSSGGGGCGGSKGRGGNEGGTDSGRSSRDTSDSRNNSTERQPSSDRPRDDDRQKSEQTKNSESSDTNPNNVKKRPEAKKPPAPENRSAGDNRRESPLKPQTSGNDGTSENQTQTQEQAEPQSKPAEKPQSNAENQTTNADTPVSKTETKTEGSQTEKNTAAKPDSNLTSREQSQKDFAEIGKKFQSELSNEERREAHKALTEQLKNISEKAGDKAAGDAVQNLNKQLEDSGSPYRFNTARMSNGQDFLSMKDADTSKLIDTRAFSDRKDPGQRAAEANQDFADLGKKFTDPMTNKERSTAHKELTDSLKKVSETSGDRGAEKAVDKLNDELEKSDSPYRFNIAKMPNGQDFLTVRDSDGKFLGTHKFQDAKPTPNQELDRTADRLTEKTSNGDRDNIHKDLTESMRKISEKEGDEGVKKALERLNERLEKNGSPYRFNTKQMSNGQDFLTMRDANKRLVNTRAFSQPRR